MNVIDLPIQPTIETDRLILRPFTLADAPEIYRLAGEYEIAATTQNIPHPYPEDLAPRWIETHAGDFADGMAANFAIALPADNRLCGAIGLALNSEN
jgi:[ribosomal protein S5]-alanine N-acetyltransferase